LSRQKKKKFKDKHSQQHITRQKPTVNPSLKFQLPRPEVNQRQWISIVPEFPSDDPRASVSLSPEGSNGMYKVIFILTVPGKEIFLDDINLDKMLQTGNSLLTMPTGAVEVRVKIFNDQEAKVVVFSSNEHGRLSSATINLSASNFLDAETQAFDLVMPILSWWSFRYDTAVDIAAYNLIEEQTQAQKWMFNLVGKVKALDFNIGGASHPEYRSVFSAYREGNNSSNPFYQFLCFYKVIEGVRNLRDRRRKATLVAGESYREPPDEIIPNSISDIGTFNNLDMAAFTPYLGKKFTRIKDELRDELRNVIAHLEPTEDCLIADKLEDVRSCELAVPVVRYMSRIMLRNEINADPNFANTHIL